MPEYLLILIRSVLAFVVLLFLTRVMGKQQISQLTFFDYIVGITIGSIAASTSMDEGIKPSNGFVALFVWGGIPILMSILGIKSYRFRKTVDGSPSVLIKDGKVQENNLRKEKLPLDQLMLLLRQNNAFKVADVEFAIMETNGKLSVMKKAESQPITPKILSMQVEAEKDPRILIVDGNVMRRTLESLGYTEEWLLGEVMKQGASDFADVFLAQVDSKGNVYVDLYTDSMKQPTVQQKPLIAATLKKAQADLEGFSLQTNDQNAKSLYEQQARNLQLLINQVEPYLKE